MKLFIFYECRYDGLSSLIQDRNYTQTVMGEINWFLSLFETLKIRGYKCILCSNDLMFTKVYDEFKNNELYFIMDYRTIPKMIELLKNNINNIFCLCYWGRNMEKVKDLGITSNNDHIPIKNVLTPFNYFNENTHLGYNINVLCNTIYKKKYDSNYGILWGKEIKYINIDLVKFLCSKNIKFYSTTITPIEIDGVINLNILSKMEWCQLLNDCKFILGSGSPKSGPTIIEALFYKKPLIGPSSQFPKDTHNSNIYFIDKKSYNDIYDIIQNVRFEENEIVDIICSSGKFNERINKIFNL
jgi:hypothetical protein